MYKKVISPDPACPCTNCYHLMREVCSLCLPVNYLARRYLHGIVALLLNRERELKRDLVKQKIECLVVVKVVAGGPVNYALKYRIGDSYRNGDAALQTFGLFNWNCFKMDP